MYTLYVVYYIHQLLYNDYERYNYTELMTNNKMTYLDFD